MELNRNVQNPILSKEDKLLLILYAYKDSILEVKEIKEIGINNGLNEIKKWNISQLLKKYYPKVIKAGNGWKITADGEKQLSNKGLLKRLPVKKNITALESLIGNIENKDIKEFLKEAKNAIEYGLYRSAVVLTWIGAMSLLQDYVIKNNLSDFNIELKKRFPQKKVIKSKDDFSLIKEYDFLQLIQSISIIGKNVKQELEHRLQLRNSCGHPNSFVLAESTVTFHVEFLILNVFTKF